ncbi:MAG: hypothetical protein ACJAQW_001029 [Paracoccaceae bacterium]|jgi:hypothetical protein
MTDTKCVNALCCVHAMFIRIAMFKDPSQTARSLGQDTGQGQNTHLNQAFEPDRCLTPGQSLARGVCRHLAAHDFVTVEELVPTRGLRVDVMALGPKSEIWVVECKSSLADYRADHKWRGYLEWCDRFFWAVDANFQTDVLPPETGLILADSYDAEILAIGPENRLSGPRRKAMMQLFARHAAKRLQALRDPGAQSGMRS